MATSTDIDDSLYSRQRYVLGDSAMQKLGKSSVLVYGMGGLGVEIAKNIALAGVELLAIQDGQTATITDLGTQFFLSETDVKNCRNRAEACAERLSELNPYVRLKTLPTVLEETSDLSYLRNFQCVILTETPLKVLIKVNQFCRSQNPPIKFVCGDVYGVFCSAFCDFGDTFEILDTDGEEPKEAFIADISKDNPGIVTCLENTRHSFEDGNIVSFREVVGMEALNGKQCRIKVISVSKFSICDTTVPEFGTYLHGGIASQVKVPASVSFKSLEEQIWAPKFSLAEDTWKIDAPKSIHLGYLALKHFQERFGRFPHSRCPKDADELLAIAAEVNKSMKDPMVNVKTQAGSLLEQLSFSSQGCLAPLCASLGGILAQEGLKALTGKFTPIQQWVHLDAVEVAEKGDRGDFQPRGDRYDHLRVCIGDELCRKLMSLKLFMVGCGAIGCEMLKNYALLGVSTNSDGLVTITDNDLIEKSNLNRQFLFRQHHIQNPKSTTAKKSILEINPSIHIEAQQYKVCPQTESTVYTDGFFERQDICVNALDNLEARRYMDSRCVTNQRPLLESGTMGPKGHVQVIVPHITESFNDQSDPVDHDVPYCTLKSFPATLEHCIQWARDKFESSFSLKPNLVNQFWAQHQNPGEVVQKLQQGMSVDGAIQVSKVTYHRPTTWEHCVQLARLKFEKYFNHKARQLLYSFPLDTKLNDGSLFWQSPKRPPTPVVYDLSNEMHVAFITSTARLYADIGGVSYTPQDTSADVVNAIVSVMTIPEFRPANKNIITDESVKKPEETAVEGGKDELMDSANRLTALMSGKLEQLKQMKMKPAVFEKDDDSNGHIDFITAASNLRAKMYSIDQGERLKVKKIAGRIIPAIATTTATVAGLVTIELIKVIKQCPLEEFKSTFFNLALPIMVLSEPAPAKVLEPRKGLKYTLWDKWVVKGNPEFTLKQFLSYFKEHHGFPAKSVVMGVKMIYIPQMPSHSKRLGQTMVKLLKPSPDQKYADLVVLFESDKQEDEEDDVSGPIVRYYFNS
ncbi:ubiquitin-like modifier-activating enzyme 6 [Liolophura sinensis]|uniref:ubiquitin-like modifier-activating enzyme 6 n=1 Tax=Liolophura sinensis TaxID=3198878 RepID=UPI003157F6FB